MNRSPPPDTGDEPTEKKGRRLTEDAQSDAMVFAFERGDFAASNRCGLWLREHDSVDWAVELGPFAAAMANDLASVDAWEPTANDKAGSRLARALRDAAKGDYASAATHLRAIDRQKLWYQVFWSSHPKPALVLPEAARPAFEQFLVDFTRAYGEADMKGLGESLDVLASSFEVLARR